MTTNISLGNWVAGLVDGEGCFALFAAPSNCTCAFRIGLRSDDVAALYKVQKAIGAGRVVPWKVYGENKSQHVYVAASLPDLRAVVAFFDRYRLRAKKRRDYMVWRKAVYLLNAVDSRKARPTGTPRGVSKWSALDRTKMANLARELKAVRAWRVL